MLDAVVTQHVKVTPAWKNLQISVRDSREPMQVGQEMGTVRHY